MNSNALNSKNLDPQLITTLRWSGLIAFVTESLRLHWETCAVNVQYGRIVLEQEQKTKAPSPLRSSKKHWLEVFVVALIQSPVLQRFFAGYAIGVGDILARRFPLLAARSFRRA
jgi:hypothetical protein